MGAAHRDGLNFVEAVDAHDFLDQIGFAVYIAAPGRRCDGHGLALAGHLETEIGENTARRGGVDINPTEGFDTAVAKRDLTLPRAARTVDHHRAGAAAANLQDQFGRQFGAPMGAGLVKPAFKAITRVRL